VAGFLLVPPVAVSSTGRTGLASETMVYRSLTDPSLLGLTRFAIAVVLVTALG